MTEKIIVPSPGESITEVELTRWLVTDGELVKKDQEIAEVDSDKATLTITAVSSGRISFSINEGMRVAVGTVIGIIDTSVEVDETVQKNENISNPVLVTDTKKMKITPLAMEFIKKNNIETKVLNAQSAHDKITKNDVLNIIKQQQELINSSGDGRPVDVIKMSMLRKKIAERLVAVKNETAMLTTFNEIDMSNVMAIRTKYKNDFFAKHQVKFSFMSFFGRAVIKALKEFPQVNSRIEEDNIVMPGYIDLCIAVSTPKGLVAPPVRDADQMSVPALETAIAQLAQKAREGKLSIDDLKGGTFTITNGGVFGSMMSTPIVNPPQSAILGMHKIMDRPVVADGVICIRPMMYVALSYDHRIIDGKESVGFLVAMKQFLENPEELLFGGKLEYELFNME